MDVQIDKTWKEVLTEEFNKPYFIKLVEFLHKEKALGKIIYPQGKDIFKAFELTSFEQVKVVILGQDPYHGPSQAHGLSFSVPEGVKTPPSLKNIYKEINSDLNVEINSTNGNLEHWAKQGVFMLNAVLTVEANMPASHSKIGWNLFTDKVIATISERKEHVVFLLWGAFARSKASLIDHNKHLVLEAAHPSPLARGAFFGCRHFSKTNDYLQTNNIKPIIWKE